MLESQQQKTSNSKELKKLIALRRSRRKSQEDAATFFRLGSGGRNTIGAWERGEEIPGPHFREPFIRYLRDFLELDGDQERFNVIWSELSKAWEWDPLSVHERQQYFSTSGVDTPPGTTVSDQVHQGERKRRTLNVPLWPSSTLGRSTIIAAGVILIL